MNDPAPDRLHGGFALLEQLRPRRGDDEQGHDSGAVRDLCEEREECVVCPLDVLENDDGGSIAGEQLDEPPIGGERLLAVSG